MISVTLYYRPGDLRSEQVKTDLEELQASIPHRLVLMDVESDPELKQRYGNDAPVVVSGPYVLRPPFGKQDLLVALGAARDRREYFEKSGDKNFRKRLKRGEGLDDGDRASLWISKHYMLAINLMITLFLGLATLAPVLMKAGYSVPAKAIYFIYSPLCHQFSFRSFFLFGEQLYYPRQLANIPGMKTYEEVSGESALDALKARSFTGNDQMGYKLAICERDVAMYGGMLLFGLIYSLSGRRIKGIRWYVWVLVGIIPIGVDGVSQLPSLVVQYLPSWMLRESTPLLRLITGALFGVMTTWYLYPILEQLMVETRQLVNYKLAVAAQQPKEDI